MSDPQEEITLLLDAVVRGETDAQTQLIEMVLVQLRRIAHNKLGREKPGHGLQTTDIVNEAYARLFRNQEPSFQNRAHFFGAAANAMRQFLVDQARKRKKLGRATEPTPIEELLIADGLPRDDELLQLDKALTALEAESKRQFEVVRLRYFLGRTIRETAEILGISDATVSRDWEFARAWLNFWMTHGRGIGEVSDDRAR